MREYELGEIIAERRFTFEVHDGSTHALDVQLGRPVVDGEGDDPDWLCPYRITGLGSGRVKASHGVDSLQALLGAVHILPVELAALVRRKGGGRLLSFGEPDETTFLSGCRTAIECASDLFPSPRQSP